MYYNVTFFCMFYKLCSICTCCRWNRDCFTGREEIAYTNENATEAYIYYDVIDKYGNSIRTSVNIVWSISSADIINVDTSSGKITIRKSKDGKESYKYGENIYVTGVDVKIPSLLMVFLLLEWYRL